MSDDKAKQFVEVKVSRRQAKGFKATVAVFKEEEIEYMIGAPNEVMLAAALKKCGLANFDHSRFQNCCVVESVGPVPQTEQAVKE